ncbi:DUF7846 domain-containing protein [Halogranum rubrum]|uniref:DUF7846 domain-containing protein n=1 Tax=Halogranum salarium B-1 TaxID=1210908 RepID=J3JFD2_9EURY|nr:glycosyltransferase family 39 protein [Halogranum salarium]EJN59149.1 hypothetical protein HSB1_25700 [Halogranum salarium B-1]
MGARDSPFDRFDSSHLGVDRYRLTTLLLAAVAAVVSAVVVAHVFPHLSLNHDEGVYLQQAAMLLDGRLFLTPPVDDAFRPWFFVESDRGLYSKYTPPTAAVFALGKLAGGYPVALAAVSAAIVGLTAALGRELYDARVGLLAGLFVLASPLFLVHAGVYLPYATTTALNLGFALAYLRAERLGSRRLATVAGAAIGLAFFARPYTAVLFAAPFITHAVWTLGRTLVQESDDPPDRRALLGRRVATAGLGSLGVAVALGYNRVTTGGVLVFPYQAFAPEDGIGFGHRELLQHDVDYTLSLALRANGQVLERLFTEWVVAGVLGTALALVGLAVLVASWRRLAASSTPITESTQRRRRLVRRTLLTGLFVSVPVGNLAFWGNYNVLGSLAVETDGLIHYLGPYYHYDLLIPTAVFAAVGVDTLAGHLRRLAARRFEATTARRVSLAVLVLSAAAFGGVAATTAADPLDRNRDAGRELDRAYEPFDGEASPPDDTVVFLPPVYGEWLNHPFQRLRNDPGFDGDRVYAVGDTHELDVAAAFPDRTLYRYVFTGSWSPVDDRSVDAELRRVERVSGDRVGVDATMELPDRTRAVTVQVATAEDRASFVTDGAPGSLSLSLTASDGELAVSGSRLEPVGEETLSLAARDEVRVTVFVQTGTSSGFSYRLSVPVGVDDGEVRTLSPTVSVCELPTRCRPAGLGTGVSDVSVETTVRSAGTNETVEASATERGLTGLRT